MIRRALVRIRQVAPPLWAVVAFLVIYSIGEGPLWYLEWKLGQVDSSHRFGRTLLILATIGLGVYRAMVCHPYFRMGYLGWLRSTPWTVKKPLPLGPAELIPTDGLAVGGLALLGTHLPQFTSFYVINKFLFIHMIVIALTFWRTQVAVFGYCALFFLGFVPQFWQRPWVAFLLLATIYVFVHEGLWRTFKRFPWPTPGALVDISLLMMGEVTHDPSVTLSDPNYRMIVPLCGWPFNRLHRDIRRARGVNRLDALLGSMLSAWWLWSVLSKIDDPLDRRGCFLLALFSAIFIAPGFRLATYRWGCRPPISLWGRIATFRWVIPGYDQVFVGPICSLLGCFAALYFLRYLLIPFEARLTVAAGVTVLLSLITPPRLRRWRLTGQHRLTASMNDAASANARLG